MNTLKKDGLARTLGMVVPIFVSFVALAVQWGVVSTKLAQVETRLTEVIRAQDKQADTLTSVQKDISFIKGKMKP